MGLLLLVLAMAAPAAAQAACDPVPGRWSGGAATPRYVERSFPPTARLSVALRVQRRARGSQRLVRLAANRVALVARAGRLVVRGGRRTIAAVRISRRGWQAIDLRLDARGGTLRVRAGRRRTVTVRRRLVRERRLALGDRSARLAGVRVEWQHECPAARGVAARTPAAPAPLARVPEAPAGAPAIPKTSAPAPEPAGGAVRPFAATSFWNRPLAHDAAIDARSSAYVAELRRQLQTTNPWINTTTYSAPVYTVPAGQPTVRVALDAWDPDLQRALEHVPIPAGARPAGGTDKHLVVHQPALDRMWELWGAEQRADGWHARWAGFMDSVSTNPGYFGAPHPSWGATATSLPLLGGLIRVSELQAGRIDHALAFAIPHTRLWRTWSWPAQRSDGDLDSPDAIPEGARFRLPASLDIDALGLPPVTAAIARAVQRYGMVLRDKSGAVSFYAEDPAPLGADPYPALFKTWPNVLFAKFPWDRLQVLETDLRGPAPGS